MVRKPKLTRKDLKLWQKVTQSVKPIEGRTEELKILIEKLDQAKTASPSGKDQVEAPARMQATREELEALKSQGLSGSGPRVSVATHQLHAIDRREKKRIVQGRSSIEARLDLHGMTQREAHAALFGFLRSSQARGFKHVLVITGKGSRGDPDPYSYGSDKGVLRRVVPKWLSEPDIRSIIVGFEEAHRSLGGAGALHIRLRSRKKARP